MAYNLENIDLLRLLLNNFSFIYDACLLCFQFFDPQNLWIIYKMTTQRQSFCMRQKLFDRNKVDKATGF